MLPEWVLPVLLVVTLGPLLTVAWRIERRTDLSKRERLRLWLRWGGRGSVAVLVIDLIVLVTFAEG